MIKIIKHKHFSGTKTIGILIFNRYVVSVSFPGKFTFWRDALDSDGNVTTWRICGIHYKPNNQGYKEFSFYIPGIIFSVAKKN